MTLSAGKRLGVYEVLSPLGAGGMGEVYRARDTRLGREVALKVLPEALAADRDRLARFEQEARAASALNHPNIVTIHDIGREGETAFIAMELVDGKTLRELSASGPMPVKRILNLAAQVCEGLSKAHGAGIVHRDLKPENVMVSKDGFVKILDFGLAKLVEPESGAVSVMPTLAQPETHPGTVMGTVGYMSPEQASGEPLDFRSDQFSVGSILYEIVTGSKAFQRKTAAETMSAIIREEPEPISRLRPDLPMPVRWILERCLAKEPEERYASTRDLAKDLASLRDHLSEASSGAEALLAAPGRAGRRTLPLIVGLALLAIGLLAGWGLTRGLSKRAVAPSFHRLTFRKGSLGNARFAPDGRTVVYGARWDGEPPGEQLYQTRPESPESGRFAFDGDILAVSGSGEMAILTGPAGGSGATLARVAMAGGIPRDVLEHVAYAGADFSPDGKDLAVAHIVDGKRRLEFPIGRVLVPEGVDAPRISPDGSEIAFFENQNTIALIDRSGKSKRTLSGGILAASGAPCWSPDGKEIWFTATVTGLGEPLSLWAVDRSGRRRLITRAPGSLELDDISRDGRVLFAHHTTLRFLSALVTGSSSERELSWLDSSSPADLSPDGKKLLITEQGEGAGSAPAIYLRGTDGSPAVGLGKGVAVALSPDGKHVLARILLPKGESRQVLLPTGAGEPLEPPAGGLNAFGWGAFTPDGARIVFDAAGPEQKVRLYVQDIAGGPPRPVGPEGTTLQRWSSPLSPDGKTIVARQSSATFVLHPLDGGPPRPILGLRDGEWPIQWTADGRGLYVFRREDNPIQISRVDLATGERRLWREIPRSDGSGQHRIKMTPDGSLVIYSHTRVFSELYLVEGLR